MIASTTEGVVKAVTLRLGSPIQPLMSSALLSETSSSTASADSPLFVRMLMSTMIEPAVTFWMTTSCTLLLEL